MVLSCKQNEQNLVFLFSMRSPLLGIRTLCSHSFYWFSSSSTRWATPQSLKSDVLACLFPDWYGDGRRTAPAQEQSNKPGHENCDRALKPKVILTIWLRRLDLWLDSGGLLQLKDKSADWFITLDFLVIIPNRLTSKSLSSIDKLPLVVVARSLL